MKAIGVDARRYVWCRSRALWIVGLPTHLHLEDLRGAQQAGQGGLLRFIARRIGEACAVAINQAVNYDRAASSPAMRSSWALDQLQEHELRQPCWELIRGVEETSDDEIVRRCESLIDQVYAIVGEIPNILTPEGQFPALSLVREWGKLLDTVGERVPPPYSWKHPS
jgi:hypothetical protein